METRQDDVAALNRPRLLCPALMLDRKDDAVAEAIRPGALHARTSCGSRRRLHVGLAFRGGPELLELARRQTCPMFRFRGAFTTGMSSRSKRVPLTPPQALAASRSPRPIYKRPI